MFSFMGHSGAAELVMLFGTEVQQDHLVAVTGSHFPLLSWAHSWTSLPSSLVVNYSHKIEF